MPFLFTVFFFFFTLFNIIFGIGMCLNLKTNVVLNIVKFVNIIQTNTWTVTIKMISIHLFYGFSHKYTLNNG